MHPNYTLSLSLIDFLHLRERERDNNESKYLSGVLLFVRLSICKYICVLIFKHYIPKP